MNCPLCHSANPADARRCRACGAALKTQSSENGAAHLPDALPDGALLIGTYAVEGVLGQGGFGITYRCHDQMLDRHVAIKEFFPFGCRRENAEVWPARGLSDLDYREARTQFLAEARVLARCHHAGIVSVHTAFEANKTAYMVMELLHGKTLAQLITARGGRMKEEEAVEIIERVGDALGFVHDLDLLHRDIKPDNIIVCDDGRVMLIDFGTAREFVKGQAQGQTVVVTPGYAPLEQYAKQAKRGAFTDIYSLAATLYHLLTGQMPPSASDRAMGVQLRPVREISPQVGASVAYATENGLQMEIAKRPQSVNEFLDLLHAPVQQVEVEPFFYPQLIDSSFDEDADSDANLLPPTLTPDALRARQQLWQSAMPAINTQPVQIAPQSVFAVGAQPSAPVPPSAYNAASGRIQVKTSDDSDGSMTIVRWILAIIVIFFVFVGFNGAHNRSYSSSHGYSSSGSSTSWPNYSSPVFNPPSPSDDNLPSSSERARKTAEAQRVWDALPSIAPASVEELPISKNGALPIASRFVGGGAVEFSPDGKRLAYIDTQAVLHVLSVPDRRVLSSLQLDKTRTSFNMMFSSDNRTIAVMQTGDAKLAEGSSAIGLVEVWSLRNEKRLGTFAVGAPNYYVWPQAVLNKGQLLLQTGKTSDQSNAQLFLWNPKTGKRSKSPISVPKIANWGYSVAAPDGKEFVVGDTSGGLHWMDFETGKIKYQQSTKLTPAIYNQSFSYHSMTPGSPIGVRGIDYALNGQWLASRNDGEISVFDNKAREIGSLAISNATSMFFSMSPDGQWLAARGSLPYSPEGTLLYNLKTKEKIRLETPYETMRDFGFSQDGKQLYGIFADGEKLQFVTWDVDVKAAKTSRLFSSVGEIPFNSPTLNSTLAIALSQSAQKMAVANLSDIQIREKNGEYIKTLYTPNVAAILLSSDGEMLVARKNNGAVELWNVPDKQKVSELNGASKAESSGDNSRDDAKNARSMAFSADNNLLAYVRANGDDDVLELWSVKGTPRRLASLNQKETVNALAFSPDSKSLICGGEKGLLQWIDVATRKPKNQIKTGEPIFDIDFAVRNLVVMGESNSAVYNVSSTSADPLQRADKTKLPQSFNRSRDVHTPSSISPDGKLLATAQGYDAVQIWELPSGQLLQTLPSQLNSITVPTLALSFSSDSTELTALKAESGRQKMTVATYRRAKAK